METTQAVVVRSLRELDILVGTTFFTWSRADYYCIPKFSESIADAWQIREKVKTWLFSQRQAFRKHLLDVVSDRVIPNRAKSGLSLVEGDLLLHVEPVDFCLAALRTKGIEITLELDDAAR